LMNEPWGYLKSGKKMRREGWRDVAFAISVPGLLSSLYLAYHALFRGTSLYCPATGSFDCNVVTSSPYSSLFGVNVAYLGLAWFLVVIALFALERRDVLLPIWAVGVVFVAYLVGTEIFLIHSICAYCTVAHASAVLLGIPVLKLPEDEV